MKRLAMLCLGFSAFAAAGAAAQSFFLPPNFGTVNLRDGFAPDPRVVAIRAGGSLDAGRISRGCLGAVTNAPDVLLNYTAGSRPLIISVAATADTTLVVTSPDGRVTCDDEGGVRGRNPAVRFARPPSGRYEIRVGLRSPGQPAPARLHISNSRSQ